MVNDSTWAIFYGSSETDSGNYRGNFEFVFLFIVVNEASNVFVKTVTKHENDLLIRNESKNHQPIRPSNCVEPSKYLSISMCT